MIDASGSGSALSVEIVLAASPCVRVAFIACYIKPTRPAWAVRVGVWRLTPGKLTCHTSHDTREDTTSTPTLVSTLECSSWPQPGLSVSRLLHYISGLCVLRSGTPSAAIAEASAAAIRVASRAAVRCSRSSRGDSRPDSAALRASLAALQRRPCETLRGLVS
eukprot:scaffold55819_cov63-Phaeocystis_antarctica.AAC.4